MDQKKRQIVADGCGINIQQKDMSFIIDRQTLTDLQIFGKNGRNGVDELFRFTRTRGGAALLEQFFRYPLADAWAINQRTQAIQYLMQQEAGFSFEPAWFDAAEQYLANYDERSKLRSEEDNMARKLNNLIGADTHYEGIVSGLSAVWDIMTTLRNFTKTINTGEAGSVLAEQKAAIDAVMQQEEFNAFLLTPVRKAGFNIIAALDQLMRFGKREVLQQLLNRCYLLDVLISAGIAAQRHHLTFAKAADNSSIGIRIHGLYHPLVSNAIRNDLQITPDNNIIFLTGANMAGKSTFMKATGVAVYLAHVGFPVPATSMEFDVRDGLLTSINLADDITMGYSHFYTEVLRVKHVAEHLANGRRLFIIFDELFRGTNVKDAYDATIAVTEAYGRYSNCVFVVSTHIVEAADVLQQRCGNISYVYLPTIMEGNTPRYTYQLRPGVTGDRHGLLIISNEQIPDILAAGITNGEPVLQETTRFLTDDQTLQDLNLTGKYRNKSVIGLFNNTVTAGGGQLLEQYFGTPLTDAEAINERSQLFSFFRDQTYQFPLNPSLFAGMVNYLRTARISRPSILYRSLMRRIRFLIGVKEEYLLWLEGISATVQCLHRLREFCRNEWTSTAPAGLEETKKQILAVLDDTRLHLAEHIASAATLSWQQAVYYELLLQYDLYSALEAIISFVHELDVYIAVGHTARKNAFSRAIAHPKDKNMLELHEAWHPALERPVTNDILMNSSSNLIFLTGANMAGKSTIMKSLGICCYLAQMGFPVPARSMEFSVQEGMFTSINVPDNINKGYSHFYAEVMRVKKVSEAIAGGRRLLVIFDELFKGTNVKDAYDATLIVSQALPAYQRCRFVISTHIVEAGQALKQYKQIQFRYMPTIMKDHMPHYTYRMAEGISDDRHGMLLINNEHVLDILAQPQKA